MHRAELEGSSGRLWGSSWVLGRVLGGAQAVPGTFAGDLKNKEKVSFLLLYFSIVGHIVCHPELPLALGRMPG